MCREAQGQVHPQRREYFNGMRAESAGLFLLRDGHVADPRYSCEIWASTTGQISVFRNFEAQSLFEISQGSRSGEAARLSAVYQKRCDAVAERQVWMANLRAQTL